MLKNAITSATLARLIITSGGYRSWLYVPTFFSETELPPNPRNVCAPYTTWSGWRIRDDLSINGQLRGQGGITTYSFTPRPLIEFPNVYLLTDELDYCAAHNLDVENIESGKSVYWRHTNRVGWMELPIQEEA